MAELDQNSPTFAPDVLAQRATLAQQKAIAQMLLDAGSKGDPYATKMAGNVAIRNSPVAGLANMFSEYLGGDMQRKATLANNALLAQILGNGASTPAAQQAPQVATSQPSAPIPTVANPDTPAFATGPQPSAPPQPSQPAATPQPKRADNSQLIKYLKGDLITQNFGSGAGGAFYKDQERTDLQKNNDTYGITPEQQRQGMLQELAGKGLQNVRPGGVVYNPSNGATFYNPTAISGAQPKFGPNGAISIAPIPGGEDAIKAEQRAKSLGTAYGKPYVLSKPGSDSDILTSEGAVLDKPQQGVPQGQMQGNLQMQQGGNSSWTPESLKNARGLIQQELTDEMAKPNPNQANIAAIQRDLGRMDAKLAQLQSGQYPQNQQTSGQQGIEIKSPAQKKFAESTAGHAADYENGLNSRVMGLADVNKRAGQMYEQFKQFEQDGGISQPRLMAGKIARWAGAGNNVTDAISGGNTGAMEAFDKLSLTASMTQLVNDMKSGSATGGAAGRLTEAMLDQWIKANPNIGTDPRATKTLYELTNKSYKIAVDEQAALTQWKESGKNPAAFQQYWAQEMSRRGYSPFDQNFGKKPDQTGEPARLGSPGENQRRLEILRQHGYAD